MYDRLGSESAPNSPTAWLTIAHLRTHPRYMHASTQAAARPETRRTATRRAVLRGAAWSTPGIAVSAVAPAYAASAQRFGVLFDGGGGSNGFGQSVYLNFGAAANASAFTLPAPITVYISVVGLNTNTTTQRSFTASSSYGTLTRIGYTASTRTTTFTWTLPAGQVLPVVSTANNVPDVLFSFGDGLAGTQRITNKIVVTGVSSASGGNPDAGSIVTPSKVPVDSTVVKDVSGVSPDGIY